MNRTDGQLGDDRFESVVLAAVAVDDDDRRGGILIPVYPETGAASEDRQFALLHADPVQAGRRRESRESLSTSLGMSGSPERWDDRPRLVRARARSERRRRKETRVSFTAPIQLPGLTLDTQWHRKSVFYEVLVRSFRRQQR